MGRNWLDISSLTLDEIENAALRIFLIGVIFIEIINNFISPISDILNNYFPKNILSVFLFLLLVTRILIKKMDNIYTILSIPETREFNKLISKMLMKHPKPRNIDIMAIDASKFYHAMDELQFHAETIRILLYEKAPNMDGVIKHWESLQSKGLCNKLEIKTYSTRPAFYSISVNDMDGFFGFFSPEYVLHIEEQAHITNPFFISEENPTGRAILKDIGERFNKIFYHHAKNVKH